MDENDKIKRIEKYRMRWQAAPKSRAFAPLADALRASGQHEEALTLLEQGLVVHPEYQAAMVILGLTLVEADRQEHGRKILQTVLKMDPDNLVALGWLIDDACARSAWETALPLLEHMVIIEPDTPHWAQSLTTAREEFAPSTETNPEAKQEVALEATSQADSFATMTLVDIYLAQGYHGRARDTLMRMQRQGLDSPEIAQKLNELAGAMAKDQHPAKGETNVRADHEKGRHQVDMAARRAREKKKFADWLGRIEGDEGVAP